MILAPRMQPVSAESRMMTSMREARAWGFALPFQFFSRAPAIAAATRLSTLRHRARENPVGRKRDDHEGGDGLERGRHGRRRQDSGKGASRNVSHVFRARALQKPKALPPWYTIRLMIHAVPV